MTTYRDLLKIHFQQLVDAMTRVDYLLSLQGPSPNDPKYFEQLAKAHALVSEITNNTPPTDIDGDLILPQAKFFQAQILASASLLTGDPRGCSKAIELLESLLKDGKKNFYIGPHKSIDLKTYLNLIRQECQDLQQDFHDESGRRPVQELFNRLTPNSLAEFDALYPLASPKASL